MKSAESRPKELPTIFKSRNMYKPNNEDGNADMKTSQFLHKIIVNDDEEHPFKHINDIACKEISPEQQQKQSTSPLSHANMKQEVILHPLQTASHPNTINASVDILPAKLATRKPLNETRL
ncbi:unnamed protein product [Onchocerca flexuosa]|uniref:Uncharacterized protein n=1 Tax=Onchocerca flexuosa TaxID=387005 RepID=A0A183H817_9BILA|nr:unnamed protein product [Onchocerca flexuosa]